MKITLAIEMCEALERRFHALRDFDTIVAAVSGGSDSLAMLRLLLCWASCSDGGAPRIIVSTVDHCLRVESANEARQVREWSLALELEHRSLRWDGPKPASGVQDAARRARYKLLSGVCKRLPGRSVIVTGHTKDDQAETVLMRLARGSGVDGLSAISNRVQMYGCEVVRPILDLSRAELKSLLRRQDQPWLDDPSNKSRDFERVRIRQAGNQRDVLGLGDAALVRTAKRMARARVALEDAVTRELRQTVESDKRLQRFGVFAWRTDFGEYPDEIGIRLLRRVLFALGGQPRQPSLSKTEALFAELHDQNFAGATLGGCRLYAAQRSGCSQIDIFRETGRWPLPALELARGQVVDWDRRFRVGCKVDGLQNITVTGCSAEALSELALQNDCSVPDVVSRDVLLTTPVIWCDRQLLAAPALGWARQGVSADATFLLQALFGSGRCPAGKTMSKDNLDG